MVILRKEEQEGSNNDVDSFATTKNNDDVIYYFGKDVPETPLYMTLSIISSYGLLLKSSSGMFSPKLDVVAVVDHVFSNDLSITMDFSTSIPRGKLFR